MTEDEYRAKVAASAIRGIIGFVIWVGAVYVATVFLIGTILP